LLWRRYADVAPPLTIVAPAFNERATIVESVQALLALKYPVFEVIVVNDGSTDDTLALMIDRFGLEPTARLCQWVAPHRPVRAFYASERVPRLLVVDKENGGCKADASNAGINASRTPVVCITDADTLIEPDALLRGVRPFVDDPRTIAVGGTIAIANGSVVRGGRVVEPRLPVNLLALIQTVEYRRAFMLARVGYSRMGALMIVSGAFGLFDREALMAVRGFEPASVGEDLELVVRLHRHYRDSGRPYAMRFLPDPIVWTQAPENLGDLARQRTRWARGAIETTREHWRMVLNPRYGPVGLIGFLQILLSDIVGPAASLAGYVAVPLFFLFGLINLEMFLALVAATFSAGWLTSALGLVVEHSVLGKATRPRDLALLSAVAVVENLGYRQLCNLWRIQGWYQYLRGKKGWGNMNRKEFAKS
jgi:cellulose synthase/poly-beta-1,6-N-acetylglucosamine synthase-like glycosyltransferase